MTNPERLGLKKRHIEEIRRILEPFMHEIEGVGVFGSRAMGTHRPNSDLDLVLYGPVSQSSLDRIYSLFLDSPLPFGVDVVSYEKAPAQLRRHIDMVAVRLW